MIYRVFLFACGPITVGIYRSTRKPSNDGHSGCPQGQDRRSGPEGRRVCQGGSSCHGAESPPVRLIHLAVHPGERLKKIVSSVHIWGLIGFRHLNISSMSNPSVQLNEPVVRIIAFEVAILAIVFATTQVLVIPLFLLFDFYLRGWEMQRFSLLRWVAMKINFYFFQNRYKPVFAPPKLFAAKIGAVLNFAIIAFYILGYSYCSLGLDVLLISFALLESLAGFCAGCYIHSYYEKLRHHLHF